MNTVVFDGGRRVGYNTDWSGFRQSFLERMPGAALGRIVQLGAGGAGAATAYAALDLGAGELIIVDAIHDRARSLADRLTRTFAGRVRAAIDPGESLQRADGLIHATPTGMAGHPGLALPATLLRPDLWVAEVVYVPLETELLREARGKGCRTLDGGGMALCQAAQAFRLFTGLEADPSRMQAIFNAFDEPAGRGR